jgi:transposase
MGGAGVVDGRRLVAGDVHAGSSWLAGMDLVTGELWRRRVSGPPSRVIDVLAPLGPGTRLLYEAGPTGYALARAGARAGIAVTVCAPGSVPRGPGERIKTDRRDAERLLRLWRAGELSVVRVPTVAEEAFRDLIRAREDARGDLMRHRHRLSKFLLRREIACPDPARAWTKHWMGWVSALRVDEPAAQAVLLDYLACVQQAVQRRDELDRAIEDSWRQSPFAAEIARLRCFRGLDTLSAAGVCAEVGDFRRFPAPRQVTAFLGIVPSEHSSGTTRRLGSITKAGSGHARRLLVEAAHQYRHPARVRPTLQRRQAGQDPRVIAIAWRAQQRLHRRHRHLTHRGKPAGVIAVAVARELACFCWEAAVLD